MRVEWKGTVKAVMWAAMMALLKVGQLVDKSVERLE